MVTINVTGTPAPQGSKLRTRFGLVDDNAKTLKPWRKAIAVAARVHDGPPFTGPVAVDITVALARPKYHYGTGRNAGALRPDAAPHPIGRGNGDADKYARAICDGLTDGGVWEDDVQVVHLTVAKVYATTEPGATIHVTPLGGTG